MSREQQEVRLDDDAVDLVVCLALELRVTLIKQKFSQVGDRNDARVCIQLRPFML